MDKKFSVVGKNMPDIHGVEKVTGAAVFISDIYLPRMLIGRVLHSPHAHARIVNIDVSKAKNLPGVETILTWKDVPKKLYTSRLLNFTSRYGIDRTGVYDEHILGEKVRYVGDAVAAVAAVSEKVAEEALELIDVEYEVLPAVFDELEAMKESAPQIHNFVQRQQGDGTPGIQAVDRNIALHITQKPVGDVAEGFRESDHVVEETAYTSKQRHASLETFHCVASFDASGKLTFWTQSQFPHVTKKLIAHIFDIPVGMTRVKAEYIGGVFGAGVCAFRDPLCVALARKSGKPVKLIYTRQEEFTDRPTRSCFGPYVLKMGVKNDGTIMAVSRKAISQAGAHVDCAGAECLAAISTANRLYRRRHYHAEVNVVYTNKIPCGSMRGFGNPEETFIREQVMDETAEKIGMDPLEFRLKNLCQAGDIVTSRIDHPITSIALAKCINIGAKKIGWKVKHGSKKKGNLRKGIGVSCMGHGSGAWPIYIEPSSAFIKFNEDASIVLTVSTPPMGTNAYSSLVQLAAEVLGLDFGDVRVVWGDTDLALWEIGTHASRTTYAVGNAVLGAANEAKEKLTSRAAKKLGVTTNELDIRKKRIYVKNNPDRGITVAEIMTEVIYNDDGGEAITGSCRFVPHTAPNYQAVFSEIEVDVETGNIQVNNMIMVHDIGRAINPMAVEGQLEGGAATGLGYALWEEPIMDDSNGQILTDDFDTYKIATTLDMPHIETVLVEEPDPTGPFGAKGVGEPGAVNQAASIANAIYDAAGIRIWELPITPERILRALKAKTGQA
ncbi:xanthine dehydrogenase family protein molybdopterin-binding subunit [Chloroflexota bacterium]